LQSGLSESVAAIVTLTDRLGRRSARPSSQIVANYAVGYNNIDVDAARQQGIVVHYTGCAHGCHGGSDVGTILATAAA
jgi:lactate dehydrogenase-like 2-hydroxyacid dehydrogenase